MPKKKKSKKRLYIFGGLGLIIIALVVVVLLQGNKEEIISVQTEDVEARTITETVTSTGTIDSRFTVIINPEVTGEIVELPVKDGDYVEKNQMLLRIKPDQYKAQKERAEANLLSAKATLAMRQAELSQVEAEYQRTKDLHTKDLVSDQELERVESQYLSTQALYRSAEANVTQNEASVREAQEQLSKTILRAPMAGTITALNVELGQRVLGSGFSQGTHVLTISDLTDMEAIVEVDENDIVRIELSDTARVEVDAFGDRIFVGLVRQIGNSAKATGQGTQEQVVNFEVKISILDEERNLRPGMSCNATIETETKEDVIAVPIQSVTARVDKPEEDEEGEEGNGNGGNDNGRPGKKFEEIVFVVEDGKAKSVPVKIGISDNNYIEVTEGLEGGETVVSGSYRAISRELKDGTLVKVEENKPRFTDAQ